MKNLMNAMSLTHVITADKTNTGADFTVRSKRTGKDYTYKISRALYKGSWYTHVKVETQYMSYLYLGSYSRGGIYRKGQLVTTESAIAIAWVLERVEAKKAELLTSTIEVFHLGACIRCGRTLTDATSIEIGLGPVCRGHQSAEEDTDPASESSAVYQ